MDKNNPPAELLASAQAMMDGYLKDKGFTIEVYFHDSEFGLDEWRFRIVNNYITNKYKRVVVEHLTPEKTDGHLCSLFCSSWLNAYSDGIEKGKMMHIKRLMEDACIAVNLRADQHLAYLNDGENESALTEQLRTQQRLRNW